MYMNVNFQNPEGRERLLRLPLGRKEVPCRRLEAKIVHNFSRAIMKAGKQGKNVFKILWCPTYSSVFRQNINAVFQIGKISGFISSENVWSERVISDEWERNGIQEARCLGQEGDDQVPLDDEEEALGIFALQQTWREAVRTEQGDGRLTSKV